MSKPKLTNEESSSDSNKNRRVSRRMFLRVSGLGALGISLQLSGYSRINGKELNNSEAAPSKLRRYYGHDAVTDRYGVIAPWYRQPNGQCDFRIRIAAETLKRYPWTTTQNAVASYPDYLFTSNWAIAPDGTITPKHLGDWSNGDLGQRSTSVLKGMVDYYRYSGDPAAIAHLTYMGDYLLDHCLTPSDHPWPDFPISVPTKGKPYGKADPKGMIQLDISASMGEGLLRAYQVTKKQRWLEAARHWGDLFAKKCNMEPNSIPWPRYANPESANWKDDPRANIQTGGVTMVLAFLDELIRLGYTGKDRQIVAARDAGLRYLRDQLLPQWLKDETWGFFFWDWLNETQNCSITADVASYLIKHKELFPNWRNDARNILTLFLNRSCTNPKSGGEIFSGAWAYPESSSCCGHSLWYAPLMVGAVMAQYGVAADNALMRELAYRQLVLQTYDVHESGVTEDNINGGVIVNDSWLNIAHPWPLLWVQKAIGWLPEELGASRENHLVRSSAVVDSIVYGKDTITYTTYDSPTESIDVFRLSYVPKKIYADGLRLHQRNDLQNNGYMVKKLPNGDAIVWIRHDGKKRMEISGSDPQNEQSNSALQYQGDWTQEKDDSSHSRSIHLTDSKDASVTVEFQGNQVRLTGRADQFGGLADVFLDGVKQSLFIDFWNPALRSKQILYYKNGLEPGKHSLKIIARGKGNAYSQGNRIYIDTIQFSSESEPYHYPTGTGPTGPQRMIFGYPKRTDYLDSKGNLWRPATEIVTPLGKKKDAVDLCWMSEAKEAITGSHDPELYRYGYHAKEFWLNITAGPAKYAVRLKFTAKKDANLNPNGFDIIINGETVTHNFKVAEMAGGLNKAVDLEFNNISPREGVIQIRFKGLPLTDGNAKEIGEAFVQAVEINRNEGL